MDVISPVDIATHKGDDVDLHGVWKGNTLNPTASLRPLLEDLSDVKARSKRGDSVKWFESATR
jgi:hypothetical protein